MSHAALMKFEDILTDQPRTGADWRGPYVEHTGRAHKSIVIVQPKYGLAGRGLVRGYHLADRPHGVSHVDVVGDVVGEERNDPMVMEAAVYSTVETKMLEPGCKLVDTRSGLRLALADYPEVSSSSPHLKPRIWRVIFAQNPALEFEALYQRPNEPDIACTELVELRTWHFKSCDQSAVMMYSRGLRHEPMKRLLDTIPLIESYRPCVCSNLGGEVVSIVRHRHLECRLPPRMAQIWNG